MCAFVVVRTAVVNTRVHCYLVPGIEQISVSWLAYAATPYTLYVGLGLLQSSTHVCFGSSAAEVPPYGRLSKAATRYKTQSKLLGKTGESHS